MRPRPGRRYSPPRCSWRRWRRHSVWGGPPAHARLMVGRRLRRCRCCRCVHFHRSRRGRCSPGTSCGRGERTHTFRRTGTRVPPPTRSSRRTGCPPPEVWRSRFSARPTAAFGESPAPRSPLPVCSWLGLATSGTPRPACSRSSGVDPLRRPPLRRTGAGSIPSYRRRSRWP